MRTAVGSIQRSLGWDKVRERHRAASAVEGLANCPMPVANLSVDCLLKNTHVPVMFWRSVGLARTPLRSRASSTRWRIAAGTDPLAFRRKLLAGKADFLHVLDMLEEKSGWGKPLPPGRGRGIAIHESFGTIVGEVAEASRRTPGP